jgi:sensor histidine kinase regulating citrate/malate metabolism
LSDAVVQGFLRKGDQATLTLSAVSSAVSKKQVVVSRQRDQQQLVVEVEDASGGIDGVASSTYGTPGSVNANVESETSAIRP